MQESCNVGLRESRKRREKWMGESMSLIRPSDTQARTSASKHTHVHKKHMTTNQQLFRTEYLGLWYGCKHFSHRGFLNTDTQINPPHTYGNQCAKSFFSCHLFFSLFDARIHKNWHTHTCLQSQLGWYRKPWSQTAAKRKQSVWRRVFQGFPEYYYILIIKWFILFV